MTFRVGQKVVCVRASLSPNWAGKNDCVVGHVYTVRLIRRAPDDEGDAILVDELSNPPYADSEECGFYAARFRPVVERKTSIEVFEQMLTDKRVDA